MGGIDHFFLKQNQLPAMPELARQLVASFDDDGLDLPTVVGLLEQDPELPGRLLHLANHAAPDRDHDFHFVSDAARLIGLERLRDLVLAFSISQAFPMAKRAERIAFWKHAAATGGYARWLAGILGGDADSAFLAGCLLRSGEIVMAQSMPQAIEAVESECIAPGIRFGLEQRILGYTHARLTAELARRWRLPNRIIDAFLATPEPLETRPFSLLGAILNLAATFADAGSLYLSPASALEQVDPHLLEHLRLDVPWLRTQAPGYRELSCAMAELLS